MKTAPTNNQLEIQGELIEMIAAHPFCHGLNDQHIAALAANAMLIDFVKDELIFREGDMANRFYLIREGQVAIEAAQHDKSVLVQHVSAGEVLGWSWLFPPFYWHFDARAVQVTKAIFLYGTRLREQCEEDPSLGFALMKRISKVVIERLQSTRRALLTERSDLAAQP